MNITVEYEITKCKESFERNEISNNVAKENYVTSLIVKYHNCATDYGRPYFTKQGRGTVRAK
jgi:hypothetical protein